MGRTEDNKPKADETYLRPSRAEKMMRAAQNTTQTVYIYGATGYGKTSLVADFFGKKKYNYYSAQEVELADIVLPEESQEKDTVVVIDDLHCLDTQQSREDSYPVLEQLAGKRNIWLILISRAPVPKWLNQLYVKHFFVVIGEEELSFTERETEMYLSRWNLSLMKESLVRISELGRGQPLGLRITAMRLHALGNQTFDSSIRREREECTAIELSVRDTWDYLESHVYDQWDIELQEFLMELSVVDRFDLKMAQQITKKKDAGRLIVCAQEIGNFIEEHIEGEVVVYELRDHMLHSMRRRIVQKYSQSRIEGLYYSAAIGYELAGNLPAALSMYEKANDEDGISRLLIENSRKYAGIANYWELRRYYLKLSEETVCQSPELMAGLSMLSSILMNDEESERWYQMLEAYAQCQTGGARRLAQIRLLHLDISLPHRGTGSMIDTLKRCGVFLTERKAVLPEVSLTNNQPSMMNGGKDFCEWSRRDKELACGIGKLVELTLGSFGKGLVSLALAESYFEKGDDNYKVAALVNKGRMQAECGGKSEMVFVAVGILMQLSFLNNRAEDAFEMLEGFRVRAAADAPQLLAGIDTMRVRFLLYVGRSGEVGDWMEQAPDENSEFCTLERFAYMAKVRVYLATGKREKALSLLQQMKYYAQKRQRTYIDMEVKILLAIVLYRMKESSWRQILQEAITQAESYHFVRILSREGAALWELLKEDSFVWKDAQYRRQVMGECEQQAALYPAYLREKSESNVVLTDKALRILRLYAEGYSVDNVAEALSLSVPGVKYYNKEIYQKLGVKSKTAAIAEAKNRRII